MADLPRTALTDCLAAAGHPPVRIDPPSRRTLVVVPHPDDESLATGGLIARQVARGLEVVVVAVTDGEAAFPQHPVPDLARRRRHEQRRAVAALGLSAATIGLGLPDGDVAGHQPRLIRLLGRLIRPGDLVVAPAPHDWHPDHEACGRAAGAAIRTHRNQLWHSLFWAHHHPGPIGPGRQLGVLTLSADEHLRRHRAIAAHRSQIGTADLPPVVTPADRAHLDHPVELYLVPARAEVRL